MIFGDSVEHGVAYTVSFGSSCKHELANGIKYQLYEIGLGYGLRFEDSADLGLSYEIRYGTVLK